MNVEDELTLADYQALSEFRYQIRRFLRFSETAARDVGLEPQQHQLLLAIRGLASDRKVTVSDIAERLQLRHHSTVELIDRLVERGLVQRARDDEDQRRVVVTLTPEGDELLRRLSRLHRTELRSSGPALVNALKLLLDNNFDTPREI